MQEYTLIHDGSDQGWQAVYLAFHVAAQFGAPLLVLLFDAESDRETILESAAQVKVGGRAAGLQIETQLLRELSVDAAAEYSFGSNGLFIPQRLVPDQKKALELLEILSCPLWIISDGGELHELAVLIDDPHLSKGLIDYATLLSKRTKQTLTGLFRKSETAPSVEADELMAWMQVAEFSKAEISSAMARLRANLLLLPERCISLLYEVSLNGVVYPSAMDA